MDDKEESEKFTCVQCGEVGSISERVECSNTNCKAQFHGRCVMNDNMTSWNCYKCKMLSLPVAPKSHRSRSVRSRASSSNSQRLALQKLEEEKELLQKSIDQKFRMEKEMLDKKYEILNQEGSRASASVISSNRRCAEWVNNSTQDGVPTTSSPPPMLSSTVCTTGSGTLASDNITTTNPITPPTTAVQESLENTCKPPVVVPTASSSPTVVASTKTTFSVPAPIISSTVNVGTEPNFKVPDISSQLYQAPGGYVTLNPSTQPANMTQTRSTINHHEISKGALAARHVVPKELPLFCGKASGWSEFISAYEFTTNVCEISEYENAGRLQKCLSGIALESVKNILYSPNGASNAIKTLARLFGKPEFVINELLEDLRGSAKPEPGDTDSIIKFSLKVENMCACMKNASLPEHLSNPLLLRELIGYLPSNLLQAWADHRYTLNACNLEAFSIWLKQKTDALLCILPKAPLQAPNVPKAHINFHAETSPKNSRCRICERSCASAADCRSFTEADISKRWELVKSKSLCRTCLKAHRGTCWRKEKCGVNDCQYGHHKLLHYQSNNSTDLNEQGEKVHFHKELGNKTFFKIVPIKISMNSKHVLTYAILDDCSSITLLEQSISDELELSGQAQPLQLKWTGETTKIETSSQLVCIEVSGLSSSKKFKLDRVRTVGSLGLPKQSQQSQDWKSYEHLRGVPIPSFNNAEPRMLIGLAHAKLLSSTKLKIGKDHEPIAAKTPLGWVIYGGVQSNCNQVLHITEVASNEMLDGAVRDYFSLESLGVSIKHDDIASAEEVRAVKIMEKTTKLKDSFYEIGLLWRFDQIFVPSSYQMAKNRLLLLEKKLKKDNVLESRVNGQILEYIQKGYARILSEEETRAHGNNCWYLPVFVVCNPNKPDKLRLVWDAAAKVRNVSLNSLLLKGPDNLTSLPGILRRFRERKVAFTGDIKEMFHQVRVRPEDQKFQRFLWRFENEKEPRVLSMNVMTFGATCSPACANYVLNLNAGRFQNLHPEAVNSIRNSHYVDDLLECRDTNEEAIVLAKEIRSIHKSGGFEIRNWSSNDKDFLKAMNDSSPSDLTKVELSLDNGVEKVLGLWWDTENDNFLFSLKYNKSNQSILKGSSVPSKRDVLRTLMSIFDPLGLLSHILIYPRILLQDIWRCGLSWDEPIPEVIFKQWKQWISNLPTIEKIRIPRCYRISVNSRAELHTFVDASEEAFACAVYVRICTDQNVRCVLVAAKSKVAPLKPLSMPRLELQAALIGARIAASVKKDQQFEVVREFYWSDSETVLSWVRSDARRYRQFVAVRVGEILEITQPTDWRWIPTKQNVADLATRKLIQNSDSYSTWFAGPRFLYEPENAWPQRKVRTVVKEELRSQFLSEESVNFHFECSVNVEDRSDWRRVRRAQAFWFRFMHNCKSKAKIIQEDIRSGPLLPCEYSAAQNFLFAKCQREGYPEEVASLLHEPCIPISRSSPIDKDAPFIDCNGVMRSNSRLTNAQQISITVIKPIILPRKHKITELLLDYYHKKYHHVNSETAVNEVRQLYIVPQLRVAMKTLSHKCQYCKNKRAKPNTPFMASLPAARLSSFTRAFSFIGIDYFGPMMVRVKRSSEKRWGVIITCLTVRAIHIEIASTLTTDSCMMCLQRFICRRGMPHEIYSDNGKNLRGASKELRIAVNSINQLALAEKFNSDTLQWYFNPPAAPHMGGAWERLVRSIKVTLAEILPTRTPTEELLNTMMHEVENIINSRPLTYVPVESDLEEALTPNHFLLGSSNGMKPMGQKSDEGRVLRNNWKQCEEFSNRVWKHWKMVYLPELRRRPTFNESIPNLEVGNIVILCDDDSPKNHWPKAVVLATYPSKDGIVRKVTIKTVKGVYDRPVSRLALLDVKPKDCTTIQTIAVPGETVVDGHTDQVPAGSTPTPIADCPIPQ